MNSVTSNAVNAAISVIGTIIDGTIVQDTYTASSFKIDECGYINLTKGTWIIFIDLGYQGRDASNDSVIGIEVGGFRVRTANVNQNNDLELQCFAISTVTESSRRVSIILVHHKTVILSGLAICRAIRIA